MYEEEEEEEEGYSEYPPPQMLSSQHRRSTYGHHLHHEGSGQVESEKEQDRASTVNKKRVDRRRATEMKARAASPRASFLSSLFSSGNSDAGSGADTPKRGRGFSSFDHNIPQSGLNITPNDGVHGQSARK